MSDVAVSVVVPTHNGSARLPETLAHIAAQRTAADLAWEVILVDNGSTDGTAAAARAAWPAGAPVPLRVVSEPRLGLSHAHVTGFAEASGELVTWVEDDNRIAPDWLELIRRTMAEHPEAGACGGFNEAVCEVDPPAWFPSFQSAYATGEQGTAAGDVTDERGFLWGAGLTVRRTAWRQLADNGFRPLLVDRQGSGNYNSGGDMEICLALRLRGWRLWYEPGLRLRHFLLAHRLDWRYLRRLLRGAGASTIGFDPYRRALGIESSPGSWIGEARLLVGKLGRRRGRLWEMWRRACEGDGDVLELESDLGRLGALLRRRGGYDRSFEMVERAAWRR